ncbi:hypothetical protein [Sandaracinobacteroides saxicola]|uniref:Uncharacterized protein n=1 Tax=Sandaracinobacteroides saxicola TaxID=2759707 RepID=A0A7G5IEE6_9SPHN|nr:hypothetical protein [Sandaracinobacteroides saxicola]QMW21738.1 hypothetical protein H3309_10005 [Sandaracinobacteroides saxicola]
MILALLALTLSDVPPMRLEPGRCLLAIWTRGETVRRIALLEDEPARLTLVLDGKRRVLPRLSSDGEQVSGFVPRASYGDAAVTVVLDLALETRAGLADGAVANAGSLRLQPASGDALVLPVGAIAGCQPAPR